MRECSGFYYKYIAGKQERIEFEKGKFHTFGVDWEEIGDGVGLFTTAVIELPDGTMLNVPVVNVKFASQDDSSCRDCLTIETDDAEHFRELIRAYTAEGYTVSSTGCIYGRWQAILIEREVLL